MDSGSSELKSLVVGIIAITLGLVILSSYTGTLIHFGNNIYKEYTAIAGIKIGEWEVLPPLASVVLDRKDLNFRSTHNGITPTFATQVTEYRLSLLDANSKLVLSLIYGDPSEVTEASELLAAQFNVGIDNRLD